MNLQLSSHSDNTIIFATHVMTRSHVRARNAFAVGVSCGRSGLGVSARAGGTDACSCFVEPEGEERAKGGQAGSRDSKAEFDNGDDGEVGSRDEEVLEFYADDVYVSQTHE